MRKLSSAWAGFGLATLVFLFSTGCERPGAGRETSTPEEHPHAAAAQSKFQAGTSRTDTADPLSGTQKMAALLEELAEKADPMNNPFWSRGRAGILEQRLREGASNDLALRWDYAMNLLNAGETEQSLEEFNRIKELQTPAGGDQNRHLLQTYLAVAHLRLGEQENCIEHHSIDSCLLPIRGAGVHQQQRGSRAATKVLGELLQENPNDHGARWLYNIAAMTLGEYPDSVPSEWLIAPEIFDSEYDLPRFYDVAKDLGLNVNDLSGGVIMDDFTGNDFLDLMVSTFDPRGQLRFFRNNGDGTFTERTKEAGLEGIVGGLNLIQADYNNDGHVDVLVLRGGWFGVEGRFPNSLLRNNGNGTFCDVTEEAGLLSFHPTQTAVWLDYNNDGWLDLFIGNESAGGQLHPCELYRNNRDGTFTNVAAQAGLAVIGFVKAVVSADFNNDGRPDLYISRLGQPNLLFQNDGPRDGGPDALGAWKFTNVARRAKVEEPLYSFPAWFWDYDNDGWPDLFVAGYRISGVGDIAADYLGKEHSGERARLFRNNRDGTFQDVTKEAGLDRILHAMGSNFGDLDNDGHLDFYVGTGDPDLSTLVPNRMFRNSGAGRFQEVTTAGGFGHLQKGHGIAFGDINNNGNQDIYAVMGGAYSGDIYWNVLFRNPIETNTWLTIQLQGVESNRSAIGARVRIDIEEQGQLRSIFRTVGSGGSFGANPLRLEAGLGSAKKIKQIQVLWPASGKRQLYENLAVNQFLQIVEGEPDPRVKVPATFRLPLSNGAAQP